MLLGQIIDSNYHGTKVVLTLMEDLLYQQQCVYIDNWYTSIVSLPGAVVKKKVKKGETVVQCEHKLGLAITHWKDKKDVFMMTTSIPDSKTILERYGGYSPANCHSYI